MSKHPDPAIERIEKSARLSAEARRISLDQLRRELPDLSEHELQRAFLRRIYRDDPQVLELIDRDGRN